MEERNSSKNTLSVKDISSIFFRIDEQIIELHNCSSEDFLGLNADFKKYYKQSKTISENASEIFRVLTEGISGDLLKELKNLYEDLKNAQVQFIAQLDSSLTRIKEILYFLDQLFLPVKNLNQDLMTLKFLLTNLKLSQSNPNSKKASALENELRNLSNIIDNLKTCCLGNDKNILVIRDEIQKSTLAVESILKRTQTDLDSILNNIHYGIIFFAEKYEETNRQIPELKQKTERSSQSIADIITNLQFHDIIRQKIEHIQVTHKEILGELERFGETIDRDDKENQNKLFLKVRDISGLQAAILVKANKEYQLAIEKITDEFQAIGNDMTSIYILCQRISKNSETSEELHLSEMLQKLKDSAIILNSFIDAGQEYSVIVEKVGVSINKTMKGIDNLGVYKTQLKQAATLVIDYFNQNKSEETGSNELLNQFISVNDDIQKFEEVISSNFKSVIKYEKELLDEASHFNKKIGNHKNFSQASESMNLLMNQLKERSDRIQYLLNENLEETNKISSGVKESITKIRYYDLFETTIVDIILELNRIYKKINVEIHDDSEKEENLKKVKSLYTMESEHQIHEKVVETNNEIDLFTNSDLNKKTEEEERTDEVELF